MAKFVESVVEDAALQWFGELGFAAKHGPHVAPGELAAELAGFLLRPTSAFVRLLRDTSARRYWWSGCDKSYPPQAVPARIPVVAGETNAVI